MGLPKFKTGGLQPYYLSIVTICLLAFLVAGYFVVYVPNHENTIVQRNYRSLKSISSNIANWRDTHDKLNETFFRRFTSEKSLLINSTDEGHPEDELYFYPNKENWFLEFYSCDTFTKPNKPVNFSYQTINGKTFLAFSRMYDNHKLGNKASNVRYEFTSRANFNNFIKDKLDTSYFESFFILDNDTVIFSNTNFTIEKGKSDSLLFSNSGLQSSAIKDFKIENSDYKIFSLPVKIASDHYSLLCATVSAKKFNEERYSLPGNSLIIVCSLLVVVLLSISLIKLVLINKFEPLNTFDVISAFLSFALLMSFLTMFVLAYYSLVAVHSQAEARHLKYLSESIGTNLKSELKNCLNQLKVYDSVVVNTKYDYRLDRNYYNDHAFYKVDIEGMSVPPDSNNMELNLALHVNNKWYKHSNRVFWMDKKGNELRSFINNDELYPKKNNKARAYFKNLMDGNYYVLDGNRFMFEPLNSGVTGVFATAVSMASQAKFTDESKPKEASVIIMSADFVSVVNPILPPPYKFAVVDGSGRVLYHSDRSRNLIENFVDECDNNGDLRSAIYAKTSTCFNADYKGNSCHMHCKPIDGLPLYVISFVETKMFSNINLQTFSYASLLNLMMMCLVAVSIFVVFLFSIKKSKLYKPAVDLKWLWYDQRMTAVYLLNLFSNITIFVTLLFIIIIPKEDGESSTKIWYCMTGSVFSILQFFITSKLHKRTLKTQKEGYKNVEYQKGSLFALIAGSLFVALFYIGNDMLRCNKISMLLFYLLLTVLSLIQIAAAGSFKKFHIKSKFLHLKFNAKKSLTLYCYMLLTWILMCCMAPSALFYELALKREMEIFMKGMQLNLAMDLISKSQKNNNDSLHQRYQIPSGRAQSNLRGLDTTNIYTRRIYRTCLTTAQPAKDTSAIADMPYRNFARSLRIPFNDNNKLNNELFNVDENSSKDQEWKWADNQSQLILHYVPPQKNTVSKLNDIYVISDFYSLRSLLKITDNSRFVLVSLLVVFILIVFFIYKTLHYFLTRIFAVDFSTFERKQIGAPDEDLKHRFYVQDASSFDFNFDTLRKTDASTDVINCMELINTKKWHDDTRKILDGKDIDSRVVRILNFDFDYTNQRSQLLKINFLEQLVSSGCRIEIYSSINPWWHKQKENLPAESDEKLKVETESDGLNPDTGVSGKSKSTIEKPVFPKSGIRKRWISVFRSFVLLDAPVNEIADSAKNQESVVDANKYFVDSFLKRECSFDKMMIGFKPIITNQFEFKNNAEFKNQSYLMEELILKVQKMASFHYYAIWENLSNEERLIIYDLAENDLTNVQNSFVVRELLQKGILVFENQLDLMNKSFRNFILTEIVGEDTYEMANTIKQQGSWSKIKIPFFIVIMVILLFIFVTQKEMFNSIILYVGAFITGITTISKVATLIPAKEK